MIFCISIFYCSLHKSITITRYSNCIQGTIVYIPLLFDGVNSNLTRKPILQSLVTSKPLISGAMLCYVMPFRARGGGGGIRLPIDCVDVKLILNFIIFTLNFRGYSQYSTWAVLPESYPALARYLVVV